MSKEIVIKSGPRTLVAYIAGDNENSFTLSVSKDNCEWKKYSFNLIGLDGLQQERDELTTRVAELTKAIKALYHPHMNYLPQLDCTVEELLNRTKLQSLARIKANAIREVAEKLKGRSDGERLIPVSEIIAEANRLEEESE